VLSMSTCVYVGSGREGEGEGLVEGGVGKMREQEEKKKGRNYRHVLGSASFQDNKQL
jgi:hypothetical protein